MGLFNKLRKKILKAFLQNVHATKIRSFRRTRYMLIKEFIQVFRDPKMRAIIFVVPVLQTLVLGYAVTTDVKNISTAIYDLDNSEATRDIVNSFKHSGYFNITEYIDNDDRMRELLDRGEVLLVLHMQKGFEEDLRTGKSVPIQSIVDGMDSNTAGIVQNYVARLVAQISNNIFVKRLGAFNKNVGIEMKSRAWFNENLESHNYYVPGVVATLLSLLTLTLTSMSIVREKEIGTIEQIMVSPITPFEFILGKTIPFIIIGFVNVTIILVVALYWFEVPLRGSLFLLLFSACLYLLTILGLGLFISTISHTQQQAMMGAFLFYFPIILLSGFIFPVENMPDLIQWFTYINPLRYFLIIIRGIFLKGIGLRILWPQILVLFIMGVVSLWQASRRFRKTMV